MGWQIFIYTIVFVLSLNARAWADNPEIVDVPLNKTWVPIGFDSNDRVQITVEGTFPNACYKVGPTHTHIDEVSKTIQVRQTAYHYKGWCLNILVPFTQVIDLGLMRDGTYALTDKLTSKALGRLPVTEAKIAAADDFLYAPVREAIVQQESEKQHAVTLTGNFSDRCMRMKDVRVHYYEDVIVVQPIAEYIGVPHNCGHEVIRFSHTVSLKYGLQGGYLLHVRVMDGQAINKILDLP